MNVDRDMDMDTNTDMDTHAERHINTRTLTQYFLFSHDSLNSPPLRAYQHTHTIWVIIINNLFTLAQMYKQGGEPGVKPGYVRTSINA